MAPRPPVRSVAGGWPDRQPRVAREPQRSPAFKRTEHTCGTQQSRARPRPRISGRLDRATERAIVGLLVFGFICGLGVLAALVPVGHGFVPKGGGWFKPEVAGGAFTLHPLLVAVPWAACFVLGLLDWRRPWRVGHLDLLALAGFFPVAMLLSDDVSQPACGWRPSVSAGCSSAWPERTSGNGGCPDCARRSAPPAGPGDADPAARPDRGSVAGEHP